MNKSTSKIIKTLLSLTTLFLMAGLQTAKATNNLFQERFLNRYAPVIGTVELNGCRISPGQLHIEVTPLSVSLDASTLPNSRHDHSRRAIVWRTANRNKFRFLIPGLERSKIHQLQIAAPPNPCGLVFWRGPFEGFVSPGDLNVRIEGIAATSEVEIFDAVADEWTGAATYSLAEAGTGGASKNIRWRSTLVGATSGELQLATSAFPKSGEFGACDEPASGIVVRADVPLDPNGWTDLGEFNFSSLFGQIFEPPDGEFPPLVTATAAEAVDSDTPDGNTTPMTAGDELLATMGAPLYLRVIPKRGDNKACDLRADGVAGWAMVANDVGLQQVDIPPTPPPAGPLEAGDGHYYRPPLIAQTASGEILPGYRQLAYTVSKSRKLPPGECNGFGQAFFWRAIDPLGCLLIDMGKASGSTTIVPGATVEPGLRFYFNAASGSSGGSGLLSGFTESFSNLVTGLYTAVSYGVDALANLYDDIKKVVADIALAGLTIPPFNAACSAIQSGPVTCGAIIETGIAVGLASMGMPPSLPNFDELQDQGIEYLAAQIQSQTGIPNVVAEQALQIAKDAVVDMAAKSGGSDPAYNWVSPWLGVDPAYVEMVVRKNTSDPSPNNLLLVRKATDLYEGAPVVIPSVFPASGELRIPMLLRPNSAGITNPVCRIDPYEYSCSPGFLATKPTCLLGRILTGTGGQVEYTEYDCKTIGGAFSPPNIYFRDEWFRQRYQPATCTSLSFVTKQSSGLGPVPPPPGYAFWIHAGLNPKLPHNWSGAFSFDCFGP
jgi:hypothetical protein